MNINRRNFFKAGIAVIASGLLLFIPQTPAHAANPMSGKRRKFADRNLVCRSYIRDYETGETVKWQHLTKDQDCEKCTYEETCIYSGTKNTVKPHNTRTFMPEIWDNGNKFLTEFINKG